MERKSKPFKILCLDGGGIKGTYSASALATIEEKFEHKNIWEYFDLIVGTSTGGILAIALASGISAKEILDFYLKFGKSIFPITGIGKRSWFTLRHLLGPKYSSKPLQKALSSVLGDKTLKDTFCHLAVTAYSVDRNDLQLFKNYIPEDKFKHLSLPSVDVALATSAAPTYFKAVQFSCDHEELKSPFLDGGICANCPALIGIIEAVSNLSIEINDIHLLSIGTLYHDFKVGKMRQKGGIAQWNKGAIDLLMHGQQACAVTTAEALLGKRMVRITQKTRDNVGMDDIRRIPDLVEWGKNDVTKTLNAKGQTYLDDIIRLGFFNEKAQYKFVLPHP